MGFKIECNSSSGTNTEKNRLITGINGSCFGLREEQGLKDICREEDSRHTVFNCRFLNKDSFLSFFKISQAAIETVMEKGNAEPTISGAMESKKDDGANTGQFHPTILP